MGMRPYAKLFFGIAVDRHDSELCNSWEEDDDFDAWDPESCYARAAGIDYDEYKEVKDFISGTPLELYTWGYDSDVWLITVNGTVIDADWDELSIIPLGLIKPVESSWVEAIKQFCETTQFTFKQPQWYLTTTYC